MHLQLFVFILGLPCILVDFNCLFGGYVKGLKYYYDSKSQLYKNIYSEKYYSVFFPAVSFSFLSTFPVTPNNYSLWFIDYLSYISFSQMSRYMYIFLYPLLIWRIAYSRHSFVFCFLNLILFPGNHCILKHRDLPYSFLQLHSAPLCGCTIAFQCMGL